MSKEKEHFDFILTTGDNFYPQGIESIDNLTIPNQIMSYFKELKLPIFPTLGNHDCYSNFENEIEYSNLNS